MSNYVEYKNSIAFHPGYYIKEIVEESGLTQEDFAKRLGTTPKNLSSLVNGKQSLSVDMAVKLSRLLGTSSEYWLNLQNKYDVLITEFTCEKELEKEKELLRNIDYSYFVNNFGLPKLARKTKEQVSKLREFLQISSLTVLEEPDFAVNYRKAQMKIEKKNIICANAMMQIAINTALENKAPKFNKTLFEKQIEYALTLTQNDNILQILNGVVRERFFEAGVILVVIPNLPGSKTNGATKKIGNNIVLMVNDRNKYADSLWFTLLHEIGHIMNADYGISFDKLNEEKESDANNYARDKLIPKDMYDEFIRVEAENYSVSDIMSFADRINRDVGIVAGRLLYEEKVLRNNKAIIGLRKKVK